MQPSLGEDIWSLRFGVSLSCDHPPICTEEVEAGGRRRRKDSPLLVGGALAHPFNG